MTLGKFKYVYSFDNVNYKGNFNARSQARRAAVAELEEAGQEGASFYIGKITNAPCPPVNGGIFLEEMKIAAEGHEYGGEYAEGWLDDVTPEELAQLETLLTEAFRTWAKKHNHLPTWQGVTQKDKYRYINKRVVLITRGVRE